MTRQRTKKARLRVRKFKKKFTPREVNLAFKENIKFYAPNLRDYLRLDNILENETLDLLDKNVRKGLISESEKDLYLAFWREIRELGQKFTDKTLESRIEEKLNEFIDRGLKEEKLLEIIDLVRDQLPRKKIFEQTKEWVTLIDWLKFKALAFIIRTVKQEFEFLPVRLLELLTQIKALALRTFLLRNFVKVTLDKIITTIATRIFSLDLTTNLKLQLLFNVERFLTFTFLSKPIRNVLFDYDLTATTFRRFIIQPTINVQLDKVITVIATRVFTLSNFLSLQLITSVRAVPTRTIILQKFIKPTLIAIVPTRNILDTEIRPISNIVKSIIAVATNRNVANIKPINRLEFSTSIRPA
jgi:hypothetical protein